MPSDGPPLSEMPRLRDRTLKVRSEVDSSTVRHDELGRKQPKTYGSGGILAFAMRCGLPAPKDVPGEFWSQDVNDDGFSCAVVACPCHESPAIEVGCLAPCSCGRYFYFTGDRVVVWRVPEADRSVDPA